MYAWRALSDVAFGYAMLRAGKHINLRVHETRSTGYQRKAQGNLPAVAGQCAAKLELLSHVD